MSASMIYSPRSLPSTAAMVKRSTHVKKRKASSSPVPAAARLPAGYAFVPPPVPLTYPATYHLIAAGPMHEAPKRKRTVFGSPFLEPDSFRQSDTYGGEAGSLVAALTWTTWTAWCRGWLASRLFSARGYRYDEAGPLVESDSSRHGDTYGDEAGSLVAPDSLQRGDPYGMVARLAGWSIRTRVEEPGSVDPWQCGRLLSNQLLHLPLCSPLALLHCSDGQASTTRVALRVQSAGALVRVQSARNVILTEIFPGPIQGFERCSAVSCDTGNGPAAPTNNLSWTNTKNTSLLVSKSSAFAIAQLLCVEHMSLGDETRRIDIVMSSRRPAAVAASRQKQVGQRGRCLKSRLAQTQFRVFRRQSLNDERWQGSSTFGPTGTTAGATSGFSLESGHTDGKVGAKGLSDVAK
ncbi:hypothetical protein DFH08DRAFT_797647 [Mycena albidolilacea]|uniref:Uncharacterized protein n=1 Tax=Mycena albidolilacea TaxID=1033008 RepID=A0AAD7F2U3_9AGAR|nr:hypothetical protein DFH08DRAFT_797647 [Mycena albidolilacea]